MSVRTPILALLLATCTALPAQALDVHVANTSTTEILSVYLAGLSAGERKMSMCAPMHVRPGETASLSNESLKTLEALSLDYGRGRLALKDLLPLKDKDSIKLTLSFDAQGQPELALEGAGKLAVEAYDLRFAQNVPSAVDIADLVKAATRGDVHTLAKDVPGLMDDPATGECILPVRAGGAVWTGVVSFAYGRSDDCAVSRLKLIQETGTSGVDNPEGVLEDFMRTMNLHPMSLRAHPTALAFCGPAASHVLEADVARVRFAELATDKDLFKDMKEPVAMLGLLVGEKAYAQCAKASGKKGTEAGSDAGKESGAPADQPGPAPASDDAPQQEKEEKEAGVLVHRTNSNLLILEIVKDSSRQVKQELEHQTGASPS